MPKTDVVTLSIRLPKNLCLRTKKLARDQDRSLASVIRLALERHIAIETKP